MIEFTHQTTSGVSKNRSGSIPKPTALRVAQLRAVHQLIDTPLVFIDPYLSGCGDGLRKSGVTRLICAKI